MTLDGGGPALPLMSLVNVNYDAVDDANDADDAADDDADRDVA